MEKLMPVHVNMETGVPDSGWFEVPAEVYPPEDMATHQAQASSPEAQPESVESAEQ